MLIFFLDFWALFELYLLIILFSKKIFTTYLFLNFIDKKLCDCSGLPIEMYGLNFFVRVHFYPAVNASITGTCNVAKKRVVEANHS